LPLELTGHQSIIILSTSSSSHTSYDTQYRGACQYRWLTHPSETVNHSHREVGWV